MWTAQNLKETLLVGAQTILIKQGWADDPFGGPKGEIGILQALYQAARGLSESYSKSPMFLKRIDNAADQLVDLLDEIARENLGVADHQLWGGIVAFDKNKDKTITDAMELFAVAKNRCKQQETKGQKQQWNQ